MIEQSAALAGVDAFNKRLQMLVMQCTLDRRPLSVALIDIDGMSRINRALGNDSGDRILREVAAAAKSEAVGACELFHYRGDAFAMIMPGIDIANACDAAERCRSAIAATARRHVTVSIGVAEASPAHPARDVVARAEMALRRAQESGGDRLWRGDDPRRHGLSPQALAEELTDREWAVMAHLVRRRTEQDIAERMGIKPGTVRSHKARIRRKLHVEPESRLSDFAQKHFGDTIDLDKPTSDELKLVIDLRD